jgi:hypothetical protein
LIWSLQLVRGASNGLGRPFLALVELPSYRSCDHASPSACSCSAGLWQTGMSQCRALLARTNGVGRISDMRPGERSHAAATALGLPLLRDVFQGPVKEVAGHGCCLAKVTRRIALAASSASMPAFGLRSLCPTSPVEPFAYERGCDIFGLTVHWFCCSMQPCAAVRSCTIVPTAVCPR